MFSHDSSIRGNFPKVDKLATSVVFVDLSTVSPLKCCTFEMALTLFYFPMRGRELNRKDTLCCSYRSVVLDTAIPCFLFPVLLESFRFFQMF